MSIERRIGYKALALYVIAGIAATLLLIFLYGVKKDISARRSIIEREQNILALTNELIYTAGEAQASSGLYLSTKNSRYMREFRNHIVQIDSLAAALEKIEPAMGDSLGLISLLFKQQTVNLEKLTSLFTRENPLLQLNETLRDYKPEKREEVSVVTVKNDTIKRPPPKRGLLRRIGDVFRRDKDSAVVVVTHRTDTIREAVKDSFPILNRVDNLARSAGKNYERNIKAIERQVAGLLSSEKELSARLSVVLSGIHRQILDSVRDSIEDSRRSINKNYLLSVAGTAIALAVILLFIILILYDVNNGRKARERIRQVMESRHKLLLAISHDIKSPLASITGYLDLHKGEGEEISSMLGSADYIRALLENLLEFSALDQGSLTITNSYFSLDRLCVETGKMFEPLAAAKGLMLKYSSGGNNVYCDQVKIKQIAINLLSNAIKYTIKGGVTFEISYTAGHINLKVEDTGAGIPEESLEELYKPFTRLDSHKHLAQGSGLGMYVVKGLTDLLGGTISFRAADGGGTIAEVKIPALPGETGQGEKTDVKELTTTSRLVAVYDDDPSVAAILRDMLMKLGHKVVIEGYDLIITDMEMGRFTGKDVLSSAGSVPVIVMTGRSDYSKERALEAGFSGYLPKPFTMEALREIVGEASPQSFEGSYACEEDEEIMEIFRESSAENMKNLREALMTNDFNRAQAICHKMHPLFAQFGYPSEELRRMDAARGREYGGWREDVEKILGITI